MTQEVYFTIGTVFAILFPIWAPAVAWKQGWLDNDIMGPFLPIVFILIVSVVWVAAWPLFIAGCIGVAIVWHLNGHEL